MNERIGCRNLKDKTKIEENDFEKNAA